jgi:hypothetical protein
MSEVNNFITDLLDEFPLRYATDVFINVDRIPMFAAGTSYGQSNHKTKVERDELIADLDALGITTDEPYFLEYSTTDGDKLVFRVVTITAEKKVTSSRFTLVDRVTNGFKELLAKTNPVRESVLSQSLIS